MTKKEATTFTPSRYQQAIYDHVASPDSVRHAVASALAGSGKTSTAIQALNYIPSDLSIIFCAFGKSTADHIRPLAPSHTDVSTFHSAGFKAYRRAHRMVRLDVDKVSKLVFPFMESSYLDKKQQKIVQLLAVRLVSLIKATLTDHTDRQSVIDMIDDYDIDLNSYQEYILELLPKLMKRDVDTRDIDFDDMIYRVITEDLPVDQYDWIMIDELQDTNRAQSALLYRMAANGRVLGIGDQRQSIYRFRGADADSMPNFVQHFDAITLPLNITYRCPLSHVRLAQQIVPELEPWEHAKDGSISYMTTDEMIACGILAPGTLALCRTNAPLIHHAYSLLRSGIPALVRGRDIGQGVIALINKLAKHEDTTVQLLDKLHKYKVAELEKLEARNAPASRVNSLIDKVGTVENLSEGCNTVADVTKVVETLFSDSDDSSYVVFSTVHKAKGLEADTVVILEPQLMPLKTKSAKDAQQEQNIIYVAQTRSKGVMVFEQKGVS